jgi:ABC-type lipoprotein release transport system permease subunit
MPETTVQKSSWTDEDDTERTQYSITIPKNLAEALDLKQGDPMDWKIASGNSLRVTKTDD